MDHLRTTHPSSLILVFCNLNCHHAKWLGVGPSSTSHGIAAKAFCNSMALTQSVNFLTRISPNGLGNDSFQLMSHVPFLLK